MHDTAFRIGCLAMDIYAASKTAKILEIGSLNVNGSLRDHAKTDAYTGVDLEAGPGVDQVVVPGQPLPFDDNSFDLIMASSVFEHDPMFWNTFLEMCRKARPGGYIYINAPSNGTFHRYPEDHWRFYPDCGLALVRWAQQSGLDVALVESFVADREAEVYNDFAAVFRKGPTNQALSRTFIYQQVICYNVRTWESDELIHRRDESEDTTIIQRNQREMADLQEQLRQLNATIASLSDQVAEEQEKARTIWVDRCVIEQLLRAAELKVQASEAAAERDRTERQQTSSELKDALRENARLERRVVRLEDAAERLKFSHQQELKAHKKDADGVLAKLAAAEAERAKLAAELATARSRLQDLAQEARQELEAQSELHRQAANELAAARAKLAEQALQARGEREAQVERIRAISDELAATRANLADQEGQARLAQEAHNAQLHQLADELHAAQARADANESALIRAEGSRAAADREAARLAHLTNWLARVDQVLLRLPAWWGLIPSDWRLQRRNALLKRENLFDAEAYVARYPDVAEVKIDPLLHYVRHGMHEDRLPV